MMVKETEGRQTRVEEFISPDNFNAALTKNYDIDAIPRFLLLDKDGKVISLDAPRPSNEKVIEYIEKALQ